MAISMPLRWMAVPKRLLVCRPKRELIGPRAGQGSAPWNGRKGSDVSSSWAIDVCRRFCAASSSLVHCACRSRRRSIEATSSSRLRTARSSAVLRLRRLRFEADQLLRPRLERRLLLRQRVERSLIALDALAIDLGHGRDGAVDVAERSHVLDVEQQSPVAGASQLVDLHQPRLDVGPVGLRDELQRVGARLRIFELARGLAALALDRSHFLDLDLPFELELPQLDEQLALFGDERLGLALQLLDAFGGALGRRLRSPRGRLAADRHDGRREQADRPPGAARSSGVAPGAHL